MNQKSYEDLSPDMLSKIVLIDTVETPYTPQYAEFTTAKNYVLQDNPWTLYEARRILEDTPLSEGLTLRVHSGEALIIALPVRHLDLEQREKAIRFIEEKLDTSVEIRESPVMGYVDVLRIEGQNNIESFVAAATDIGIIPTFIDERYSVERAWGYLLKNNTTWCRCGDMAFLSFAGSCLLNSRQEKARWILERKFKISNPPPKIIKMGVKGRDSILFVEGKENIDRLIKEANSRGTPLRYTGKDDFSNRSIICALSKT